MKKDYCVDNINMQDIILMEKVLFEHYRNVICKFEEKFSSYKCKIKLIECWTTGDSSDTTKNRPTLDNKYVYWICYQILYNGKPFIYDDENSPLSRSYVALKISKKLKHHKPIVFIKVFDDTDDVIEELEEDLNKLKQRIKTGDGSMS